MLLIQRVWGIAYRPVNAKNLIEFAECYSGLSEERVAELIKTGEWTKVPIRKEPIGFRPIGHLVADEIDGMDGWISIGISICHYTDKFNKVAGRQRACERVQTHNEPYQIRDNIVDDMPCIEDQFWYFVDRCNKYFREDRIILPKVKFV